MEFPKNTFPYIIEQYEKHDPSCESLKHAWFGHSGGVTDWNEIEICDTCGMTFWIDGLNMVELEYEDLFYCDCCFHKIDCTSVKTSDTINT